MTGVIAAAAAAAATCLLLGGLRLPGPRVGQPLRTGATRALALIAAGGAATALLDGTRVVLALVGVAVAAALSREVERRRRAADAARRAEQVLATCEGLASDLRAGQPPVTALAAAAADWPELTPVATAAELGADVPAALRELAARPGAGQVRIVAAAWQVAHRSGAGLADALTMAAERLRADRATARVVATEMAAAQATARLLAALPIGVLVLGSGLGGDPFGFLVGTPAGLVCLCTGLLLEYAGLSWLARISDQVLGRR
jgi:tight adherence protein B